MEQQGQTTTATMDVIVQLHHYAAMHPEFTIHYAASEVEGRSRVGEHFFLNNSVHNPKKSHHQMVPSILRVATSKWSSHPHQKQKLGFLR
eukprot:15335951-Ditylum_brightwellii.AAC.1